MTTLFNNSCLHSTPQSSKCNLDSDQRRLTALFHLVQETFSTKLSLSQMPTTQSPTSSTTTQSIANNRLRAPSPPLGPILPPPRKSSLPPLPRTPARPKPQPESAVLMIHNSKPQASLPTPSTSKKREDLICVHIPPQTASQYSTAAPPDFDGVSVLPIGLAGCKTDSHVAARTVGAADASLPRPPVLPPTCYGSPDFIQVQCTTELNGNWDPRRCNGGIGAAARQYSFCELYLTEQAAIPNAGMLGA